MIRQPSEMEAHSLLISCGVQHEDRGHYFSIRCPFHKNGMEKTPSAVLYKQNWWFRCFTCGTNYSFAKLYKELKHEPWSEYQDCRLSDFQFYRASRKERSVVNRQPCEVVEGRVTSVYDNIKALAYARSRFLSDDFISFFNILASDLCRLNNGQIWHDRLLIPIEYERKPYSLEGRDYLRTQKPKCLYPKGSPVDILFNQDNLDKSKDLIVCEGTMDIPKIWDNITRNVTCTFGVSLTAHQKEFLKDCQHIILFIDDDSAGLSSVGFFEQFMTHDFKVAKVKGKDPGDATLEETYEALARAEQYGEFLIKEVGLFSQQKYSLSAV